MGFNGNFNWGDASSILSAAGELAGHAANASAATDAAEANQDQMETRAREAELDAKATARRERQQAAAESEELRREKQRLKAKARAMWGKSGVAGSGSAARVVDGMDAEYENRIADTQTTAKTNASAALRSGAERAKAYRDRAGNVGTTSPWAAGQTIIGLGSKLFDA